MPCSLHRDSDTYTIGEVFLPLPSEVHVLNIQPLFRCFFHGISFGLPDGTSFVPNAETVSGMPQI
jgi:hypothetical protein